MHNVHVEPSSLLPIRHEVLWMFLDLQEMRQLISQNDEEKIQLAKRVEELAQDLGRLKPRASKEILSCN